MEDVRDLVKITFPLDPHDWHGRPSETLWAKPERIEESENVYRLRNSPFFARGVSFLDTVNAVARVEEDGLDFLEFSAVVGRNGHSTYMLLVSIPSSLFAEYWRRLDGIGCSYESKTIETSCGTQMLYSVDVPKGTHLNAVYSILAEGEARGV